MALRVQQIFARYDLAGVDRTLRQYVREFGKQFTPHHKYNLNGVSQVLENLIKSKREFLLLEKHGWTVIWEVVHHMEFADPAIPRFLAERLNRRAIWVDVNDDFNLWAFQEFDGRRLVAEQFSPASYFLGNDIVETHRRKQPAHQLAERFNKKPKLPAFLVTLPQLERSPRKFAGLRKITCKVGS